MGVARDNEASFLQQVKDSEALLEAGRVTRSALLEAQVIHDNAKREREKAESLVPIKRMTLNEILGCYIAANVVAVAVAALVTRLRFGPFPIPRPLPGAVRRVVVSSLPFSSWQRWACCSSSSTPS